MPQLLIAFAVASVVVAALARPLGRKVFPIAALAPTAAFVATLAQGPGIVAGRPASSTASWIPELGIALGFRVDVLAFVLALVVTGVGALVLLYCTWYFTDAEPGLGRFAGVLTAFAGAMYGLVVADDVYVLFTLWELTTLFSYLLVGHYDERPASRGAALEALLVTTLGGLAMLVGLVVLSVQAHTTSLAAIVAHPPPGPATTVAVLLVVVGAVTKSALVPFHFWLPGAMAAPTPVSAYLHSAAMVKAGVYLFARLAPGFSHLAWWTPLVVAFGVTTMLIGGRRALAQHDLKLVLAYGTVAQLGFLSLVAGYGTRGTALAAAALVTAHALFKSTLFLVTGVVDKAAGTRDLRRLSRLGSRMPVAAVVAVVAAASMAGVIPTAGFVAKETALSALLTDAEAGGAAGVVAVVGVAVGSVLTVAYSARFVWGAFGRRPDAEPTPLSAPPGAILGAPVLLAAACLGVGLAASPLDRVVAGVARALPATRTGADAPALHLALWHGLEPALGISVATLVVGAIVVALARPIERLPRVVPVGLEAGRVYWAAVGGVDRVAARVTGFVQRGSVPFYLGVILSVLVASVAASLAVAPTAVPAPRLADSPAQLVVALLMAAAALAATGAAKRYQATVLVGVTGYGMAALFALHGAPDLALTQALVETITLIAVILVLRRLPVRLAERNRPPARWWRILLGVAVGATIAVVAVVAAGARVAAPISLALPRLAVTQGHGDNVVNVMLVDIRGWDTMGELSVLIVAATGVASLVFLTGRSDSLPRRAATRGGRRRRRRPTLLRRPTTRVVEPVRRGSTREAYRVRETEPGGRAPWLLAGRTLAPENRSILLEAVVRVLYHPLVIVSLWLLFAGHDGVGGGFAGGLVAGLALTARYLAGGRFELATALPVDAGRLLGAGLALAAASGLVPLAFGADALTSTWFDAEVPVLGHVVLVTSTVFDVGVYLVVVALVLDVLRSLGAEIDRQDELAVPVRPSARPDAVVDTAEPGEAGEHGATPSAGIPTASPRTGA